MSILIKDGRVIDPVNNIDGVYDILVKNDKIAKVAKAIKADGVKIIDAKGKIVVPGLIDMHTHLRQPGREDEETFASGSRAAARGGFTTICAMPNTEPVCDNRGAVEYIISESKKHAVINILPIGAITVGQKGEGLTEVSDMGKAGIAAISDDGFSVKNTQLMRKALEYAGMYDVLVISHCEDLGLTSGGAMNEGLNSTLLGMRGVPNASEAVIVARDIQLAKLTGARLHIAHVSTKEAVHLIRQAKREGIKVTAETCPHYLLLTDDAVKRLETNYKVNPPLRAKEDIKAVKEALKDSTIDVIATDHAPHAEAEKDVEFDLAASGMIGLETALALIIEELVAKNIISWGELVSRMSSTPARILGLKQKGSLSEGYDADITIIDPEAEWVFKKEEILSRSKNSPFIGRRLKGRVLYTICSGKVVYEPQ
ncbi:MAG: dihydroorotase [Candidatus Omnitrophota bacterium]